MIATDAQITWGGGMEMVRIYPTNIETTFNISGVDLIGENKIGAS